MTDAKCTAELAEALKIWQGSFYVLYGNSQKLVGHAISNFTKSGRAAALPAQQVPPALNYCSVTQLKYVATKKIWIKCYRSIYFQLDIDFFVSYETSPKATFHGEHFPLSFLILIMQQFRIENKTKNPSRFLCCSNVNSKSTENQISDISHPIGNDTLIQV